MLNIDKKLDEGTLTVTLEGRLDTVTAPDLDAVLKESYEGVTDLVMDFDKLEYISSAGLRVLLAAQKIMNAQGSMKLTKVNEAIMGVCDVTGFSEILTIE